MPLNVGEDRMCLKEITNDEGNWKFSGLSVSIPGDVATHPAWCASGLVIGLF